MTDLRALLAHIDRVLAECDASRLPPLDPPLNLPKIAHQIPITQAQLDSTPPNTLARNYGGPVPTHGPVRVGPVRHVAESGPLYEPPPIAVPKPASWWRRILRP